MKPSEIKSLLHSPLWISFLLECFLSGAQKIKKEGLAFEFIFLAIPILLDEGSLEHLSKGNVKSNISKIMNNSELQSSYFKAKWNIEYYKPVTKKAIIVLSSSGKISVSNRVFLYSVVKRTPETDEYKRQYYKAAYNLGAMLAKEDPLDIMIKFGVI